MVLWRTVSIDSSMFAVGHLALGYIIGKGTARFLNLNIRIPLMFLVSILPDVDFLVPGLTHRGPMHSIIVYALVFVPIVIVYGKVGIVYFLGVVQHLFFGDFLTAGYGQGIQLLWPLTTGWYSAGIHLFHVASVYSEWIFFLVCITWMFVAKDFHGLLVPHASNLVLAVPMLSIILPVFFDVPLPAPLLLLVPHLVFLLLFLLSILIDFRAFWKRLTKSFSER